MKTVLITGAGRGLGRAIANAYYQNNFRVIATDIDLEYFTDIKDKEGFICLKLDITSETDIKQCVEFTEKYIGRIDVLISNAGIFDFYPVSEAGSNVLSKIFSVNVFAVSSLTKYFLPLLEKSKGRLIVIGSESFKVPSPFQPYSVSKQALESVYKAIKIELSLKEIKCILIRPGAMNTKILDDTIHFNKHLNNSQFTNEFNGFIKTVPKYIGRTTSPENVAKTVFKAGTVKHPKAKYHINHNPLVSLLSALPGCIQNILIRKSLARKK